jgi:hypothetical protein
MPAALLPPAIPAPSLLALVAENPKVSPLVAVLVTLNKSPTLLPESTVALESPLFVTPMWR